MFWYEVPIIIGEEGGISPSYGGQPGTLPPGGVFHVLKAVDNPSTGLRGSPEEMKLFDGWEEMNIVEARGVFARFYKAQPSDRAVFSRQGI